MAKKPEKEKREKDIFTKLLMSVLLIICFVVFFAGIVYFLAKEKESSLKSVINKSNDDFNQEINTVLIDYLYHVLLYAKFMIENKIDQFKIYITINVTSLSMINFIQPLKSILNRKKSWRLFDWENICLQERMTLTL